MKYIVRVINLEVALLLNRCCAFILCTLVFTGCAEKKLEPIKVEEVFFHELAPNQTTAAAYMRISNQSSKMQVLNYIHSPAADHIELHRTMYTDGMMQMRPVSKLSLSPGETKILEPGGFHLMIFGLYDPLKAGDTFELTLEFESGEVIQTKGVVKSRS